jgi:hypothetical protein
MKTHIEPDLKENHLNHRKRRSFRGSSPSDSGGRETSYRDDKRV